MLLVVSPALIQRGHGNSAKVLRMKDLLILFLKVSPALIQTTHGNSENSYLQEERTWAMLPLVSQALIQTKHGNSAKVLRMKDLLILFLKVSPALIQTKPGNFASVYLKTERMRVLSPN